MLDYRAITKKYYAEWLDCDERDFLSGVRYVCSPKRDVVQTFYSSAWALCLFKTDTAAIISYSSKIQKQIKQMEMDFSGVKSFDLNLGDYLDKLFGVKTKRNIKFVFDRQIASSNEDVVSLSKADYDLFLNFRVSLGNNLWDEETREYFEAISALGYCMARMADGKPVSMTDTPTMPYMSDMVQEVGIDTLPDYRNRGYAKEVVSACISKIISDNKCPQWSCDADNRASERLAYRVGFKRFCDVYSIVL